MKPCVADPDFTLYVGDVREVLAELPDESVHMVCTSPPYWGLRDYGVEGQLGLEPTPDQYVQNMVAVFREVRRVLRRDGTCWLNLGDSYAGAGYANHTINGDDWYEAAPLDKRRDRQQALKKACERQGIKPKDLVGIPWKVAFALQADGWYLRADIIWAKPNPMPESVTDRPTKAHEYLFLLTRSPRYFFDQEAVREPETGLPQRRLSSGVSPERAAATNPNGGRLAGALDQRTRIYGNGRNVRSVWEIPTQPYPEAHFATFPEELARRCILAGTSEKGCCPECGAPWIRETDVAYEKSPVHGAGSVVGRHYETGANNYDGAGMPRLNKVVTTTGWKMSCGHDQPPVPCVVLDPFLGSGTTALVARRHGRKTIGIELNPQYAGLAARRLQQLSLLAEETA